MQNAKFKMHHRALISAFCILHSAFALGLLAQTTSQLERDVRILASDEYEGRGLGTKGLAKATDYLEKRAKAVGLAPAFGAPASAGGSSARSSSKSPAEAGPPKASYRQSFPVKTGVAVGENNRLDGVDRADWTPLAYSSSGAFAGEVVFAGYGISAPPLGYDDFAGLDLKGKVALILRYEPQERDEKSPFDGRRPSRWSALRYKVLQARERGAAAVVFVTGPLQDEGGNKIPALVNDGPESAAGIPVIQVKTSVAQKWIPNLADLQKEIDGDLKPRSRATGIKLSGNADVRTTIARTDNVAGVLAGRGKLASQIVVIGAHYDHLGHGGQGSLKPNVDAIHNGADDNASGTAAVLSAAERLTRTLKDAKDRRTIVFAWFSAEESGLGGSSYFVANAPFEMKNVVAMVNLDMVGALRDDKVVALGTESAPEWKALIERAGAETKLAITSSGDGYGPSDQTSFYAKQIPVLHFFTGAHERYHTPEDDADAINYAGAERIAGLTAFVAESLARGETNPAYARVASAPAMQGDSRGYGAYLGTVPEYSAMESSGGGVALADVRPGSPAEKAGIKGGDKIVEMAGTRIENLMDMTFALQDHKPGDTIDVVVLRGGARTNLRATLGTRGAAPAATSPHGGATPSSDIKAGKPFEQKFEGEKHLAEVRQLTFGGENAEAYFSPDGKKLIYQSTLKEGECDQQYVVDLVSGETKRVSSGKGRTTCGYFRWPAGDKVIYASTESGGEACPPPPDRSLGYVWGIYPSYEIYEANADGSNVRRLTNSPGYDAEATYCHQGGKFIFTSVRDGDIELYEMDDKSQAVKRLTNAPGYDGGAFYSADCKEIVWRANRPSGQALTDFRDLLGKGLVRPTQMELYVMNADGTNARQITSNGAANFCPYFHPDGNRIIYASNAGDPKGREFDILLIDKRGGKEPERITYAPGFDGFPMFSPDGKHIVWASNRANPNGRETNLFIARWVE
jgi:Tol biopolymer transport system component